MRIRTKILRAAATLAAFIPVAASAQSSSINTFSPYTMYGLGDLTIQGSTNLRTMGGIGVAFRDPSKINSLNPASYTSGMRRSFLIDIGLEDDNYYLKDKTTASSYNTFNIHNIGIAFPLGRIMSFGFSVAPASTVGYRIATKETNPDIVSDLKKVDYTYEGQGGLTQMKAGVGVALGKRLSLGGEVVYYLGDINRSFNALITSFSGNSMDIQNNIYAYEKNNVSRIFGNFGVQYNAIMDTKRMLTVGVTYQPGGKLDPKVTRMIPSGNISGDTILMSSYLSDFRMADMMRIGALYRTVKFGVGVDYSFSNWAKGNASGDKAVNGVSYRNTSSISIGGEYTPNVIDVRHFMNRMTYRLGLRYSDYYMTFGGKSVSDKAITFGVGIPLRSAPISSSVNVGLEFGQMGAISNGLIRQNYFKVSLGFTLFSRDTADFWFTRPVID